MLFPNAKRVNLKESVSPISDLWKRFRMSLGHEFTGKKSKTIKRLSVRTLELHSSYSEKESNFCISASGGRFCQFVGDPETKSGLSLASSPPPLMSLSLTQTTPQQPLQQTHMSSFAYRTISLRTTAERLGIISQKPGEMSIRITFYISFCIYFS